MKSFVSGALVHQFMSGHTPGHLESLLDDALLALGVCIKEPNCQMPVRIFIGGSVKLQALAVMLRGRAGNFALELFNRLPLLLFLNGLVAAFQAAACWSWGSTCRAVADNVRQG